MKDTKTRVRDIDHANEGFLQLVSTHVDDPPNASLAWRAHGEPLADEGGATIA